MRIVFFGSDDFSAVNLQHLLAERFEVLGCVTQPDRPKGRGLEVMASPIKVIAQEQKIPVLQPEDLKRPPFLNSLQEFEADLFVVIAYGKILPSRVLKMPKIFCINVHGSLLPKYRGAAPVNWAIINGERETGFTIIKMNSKMDAGEIIFQETLSIAENEVAPSLRARMAQASAHGLCRAIRQIEKNEFALSVQDESAVTLAPKLSKDLGCIDWQLSAKKIHDQARGLLPWPAAYTSINGKNLKIIQSTKSVGTGTSFSPGTILQISKDGLLVAAGTDALLLEQVQPESGKPMPAQAFALGQRLKVGNCFE